MPTVILPVVFCFPRSLNVATFVRFCIRRSPVLALFECRSMGQPTAIDAHRPSHSILTSRAGAEEALFCHEKTNFERAKSIFTPRILAKRRGPFHRHGFGAGQGGGSSCERS